MPKDTRKYGDLYRLLERKELVQLRFEDGTGVAQHWVNVLPIRMQSVIFSAIRGPDNMPKHGGSKKISRWFRRCVLVTYQDRRIYQTPWVKGGGGSFMREWNPEDDPIKEYMDWVDSYPIHYHSHFIHAVEILAYRHPIPSIREFWWQFYFLMVDALHLNLEQESQFESRYSDSSEGWELHLADSKKL